MYKIENKSNHYYLYNITNGKLVDIGNKEDLIFYVAKNFSRSYVMSRKKYLYLEEINFSGEDVYHSYSPYEGFIVISRPYIFFNGEDAIIDIRIFNRNSEEIPRL